METIYRLDLPPDSNEEILSGKRKRVFLKTFQNEILNNISLTLFNFGEVIYTENDIVDEYEPANSIQCIMSGFGRVKHNKTVYQLKPNHIYFFPPGNRILFDNKNLRKLFMKFKLTFNNLDLFANELPMIFSVPEKKRKILIHYAHSIHSANLLCVKSVIYDILSCFKNDISSIIERKNPLFERFSVYFDYIKNNKTSVISISDISRLMNMNKSHFICEFKKAFKTTPKHYFLLEKTNKAKEMLAYTAQSIREISTELGFYDQYYFSKFFKKMTSCSPKEFREMKKNTQIIH